MSEPIYMVCGECKWHTYEDIDHGWVCTNPDSPYCADWTEYEDDCDYFQERGIDNE